MIMHALLLAGALAAGALPADMQPKRCQSCEAWNAAQPPFRIHGDTYYVGTQGLAAVLIDSGAGLVLIDGALPQSAPRIAQSIEELGFGLHEIDWILTSHAHFDHAGGIAALARMSGARVAASARAAEALREGMVPADDPQFGMGEEAMRFPAVQSVTELGDRDVLSVGDLRITAHATPGHTPGGMSYAWQSCEDGECLNIVYADSLTPVSADGFRFTGGEGDARVAAFRDSIARVAGLPCDVLVATHPEFAGLFERHAARSDSPDANAFVDAGACLDYARRSAAWLERRIAEERGTAP